MHSYPLLELLAVGFVLALFFGYLARLIGLSPIVGYLLAGFLAGPNFSYLPFVANPEYAGQLAEAGVILLMFGVGLHFKLEDLKAVKGVAVPGALIQIAVASTTAALMARAWGFSLGPGLVLGLGLSVASTVVLLRALEDNHVLHTAPGHVAVGWLIVEDIFTVLVLVILPTLASASASGRLDGLTLAGAAALAVLKLALMWAVILMVGGRLAPWFLIRVARTRSSELFTLTVLVIAFATAVGAAAAFDASMALGAFLGGLVVGKSSLSHQAGANILPLKDAFSVLFFVSVGLLFDPAFLVERPGLVASALSLALLLKPLTAIATVSFLGYSVRTALTVGAGLAQVGEFSFILANAAHELGLIPRDALSLLVICCLVSISLNSSLVKAVPAMEEALRRRPGLWRFLSRRADRRAGRLNPHAAADPGAAAAGRALVVGYGPTGRKVTSALLAGGLSPVVIDLNVDTVAELIAQGRPAVFGDASEPDVLRAAGIDAARYLVITIPDISRALATVARAKDLNPGLRTLVRARFLQDQALLENLGVSAVAFEEAEVAETLSRLTLLDVRAARRAAQKAVDEPRPDEIQ